MVDSWLSEKKSLNFIVPGGEANGGPPIGPALGPLGLNVLSVVKQINEVTEQYKGMKVPVTVEVNTEDKSFNVTVKLPSTSALLVKEAGAQKGSGTPKTQWAGNISASSLIKVANMKLNDSTAMGIKETVKEVLGVCVSMGIQVDGKDPRDVMQEVKAGKWDKLISEN